MALLIPLLLIVAALRSREAQRAQPSRETIPGRLFFDDQYAVRLWMPTPARNLPLLAPPTADALPTGLLSTGVTFGPFALPPAREAVVALSADGGVAAFRFARWQATLARWAGRLAGNPVLEGGRLEGTERDVTTVWLGSTWLITVDATWQPEAAASTVVELDAALGWLALGEPARRELGELLRVDVADTAFEIVDLDGGWGLRQRGAAWAPSLEPPHDVALAAARLERDVDDWALTLLEAPQGPVRPGELRLPSSGARFVGPFSPRRLPAGRWLEDLALNPLFDDCGAATCVAWDQRGLHLARTVDVPAIGSAGTSVWIWNDALADFLDRFATGLDGLLLVPSEEVRAAQKAAEWSKALGSWQQTSLHAEPTGLAVRFFD